MALEVVWDIAVVWFHNMPIKLIWLGGVLNIVGGGNAIIIGMIFSIATDATTDEERQVFNIHLESAESLLTCAQSCGLFAPSRGGDGRIVGLPNSMCPRYGASIALDLPVDWGIVAYLWECGNIRCSQPSQTVTLALA